MKEHMVESAKIVLDLNGKIRVLHVDDDSGLLKIAKQCLEMEGPLQVDTAPSVEEALGKLEKDKYDVVVSDYQMSEKDGLEFLKELREKGNMIPFIIFTGKGREEVAVRALNLGANQYLSKTGDPAAVYSELVHGIMQAAKRRKAEEKIRESELELRSIFDAAVDGIAYVDAMGKIIAANKRLVEEMLGYTMDETVGGSFLEQRRIEPNELPKIMKIMAEVVTTGKPIKNLELTLIKKDGTRIPTEVNTSVLKREDRVIGIIAVIRDITERKKAQQRFVENQQKFAALFSGNPEATVYVDSNMHVLDINPRFASLFGYSLDEVKGKRLLDLIVPEDKKDEAEMLDRKAKEAYTYGDAVRKRKDGTLVTVSISAAPVTVEGQPVGYVGLYRDVTERKHYENSLSALNTYSRNLNMAKTMEEIYELTLDAAEKTLGFEFADIFIVEGKILHLVTHRGETKISSLRLPLDGDKGITVRAAKTGKPVLVPDISKEEAYVEGEEGARSELVVPIKVGPRVLGVLNVESRKLNAFDEKDQELLEILASHAATAIGKLEYSESLETYAQQIRENQQKFERLFMDNPEAAVYLDPDFHILDVNPRFTKLFGFSLDEVKGKHIDDVVVPKDKIEEAKTLGREFMKGYTYYDTIRKRKDGSLVPVAISGGPLTIEGKIIGTLALYMDITERKHYETSLSTLNNYSHNLNMANTMEEIYELTLEAAEKTLGFRFADILIIEGSMLRIVSNRGRSKDLSVRLPLGGDKGITVKAARTGKSVFVPDVSKEEAYVKSGADILSELAVPIKIGDRVLGVLNVESKKLSAFDEKDQELVEILASHAATAISNITRRYEIERHSSQLALLMKSSAEVIHSTDLHHRLQSIVEAIKEIGWRRVGIRLTDENLDTLKAQDIVTAGFTHEEKEFMWKNRATGQVWRRRFGPEGERFKIGEFYYFTWSDPWVRKMFSRSMVPSKLPPEELGDWDPRDSLSAPLRLADGRIVGILGIDDPLDGKRPTKESLAPLELFIHQAAVVIENAQLIQLQKEYMEHLEEKVEERTRQLKDAHEQLIKSERLAAIGQVAAMVGHDLRNPLTGIKGAAYYLKAKLGPKMDERAREMLELIEKDVEHSNEIITDLMEYTKEIRLELTETTPKAIVREALFLVEVPKNVKVLDLAQDEPRMRMDFEKVKRVFGNLAKNAVDAMPNGGRLTIASYELNDNVEIAFADTGIGMTKEVVEKIWTPFFTTKAKGMGLGLAICKRIIEAHEGSISVESTVGEGTTFTVTVPIKPKSEVGEKARMNVQAPHKMTVL